MSCPEITVLSHVCKVFLPTSLRVVEWLLLFLFVECEVKGSEGDNEMFKVHFIYCF